MNTNIEKTKPNKCPRCNIDFPDDNMRWPLHNINKHIKACEDKYQANEKIKNSKSSLNNYFCK